MSEPLVHLGVRARDAASGERPRVAQALRRAMRRPVTLIVAPPGFGKSAAVATLTGAAVCRLPPAPVSLAEIALAIACALAPDRNGLENGIAGCMRTAGERDAAPVLAAWLAELVPDRTVVVDDLDAALGVAGTAALIADLIERTAAPGRWVLAARSVEAFPVARWMARGLTGIPLDETVLGVQPDELRRMLAERRIERSALPNVEMRLATAALACDLLAGGAPRRAVASAARSLQHTAQLAFDDADEDERQVLALAVHLPRLGAAVVRALPVPGAESLVARLRARLPAAFDARGVTTWFRAAVRERIAGDARYAAAADAARAARARGAPPDAWSGAGGARSELEHAAEAFRAGDTDGADAAARRAVAAAEECDAFDVAARAYALLFEIAREAAEPAAELAALERLERCAALAGEHELRALALVQAHARLAERGDADGMRRLEHAFAFLAPALEHRARIEATPGRALRLAWEGRFAAAHAAAASGTLAGDAVGRALHAAALAAYAAAAGLRSVSAEAATAAQSELYQVTESATRDRVLASLALAATLTGDDDAAHRRLPRAPAGEASRRTAVLLDAVAAYRRSAHGDGTTQQLAEALDRARERGFGGFARLIEAVRSPARERPAERIGETLAASDADAAATRLIARLAEHDPASADHARSVADWCARIAERLGFDAARRDDARRCGLLHDAGKVDVPVDVLNAPRALTAHELALVRTHPPAGELLVLGDPALAPLAPGVRAHHERYDGRGYPDRIAGDAIPPLARIVAVADAFDAMIAPRPYRAPRTPAAALLELHRERGRQFDPEVVDAMIAVVEDHG